jgi:hypothetical protein
MSTCPRTGVSVPECCCPDCVERMLAQKLPEVLDAGKIRVSRTADAPRASRRRRSPRLR